ncbi:MAG: HypC/HybG/HupF family hydrogenase formation chaperone [Ilumatobacteraceae bacterium]
MCLAVPGKLIDVSGDTAGLMHMGHVDFGGIVRHVSLAYVPDAVPGDYVVVHVGFAIARMDEESALETLQALRDLGMLEAELGMESEVGVA